MTVYGYKMLRSDYTSLRDEGRVQYDPEGGWTTVPGNGAYVAVRQGLASAGVGPVIVRMACAQRVWVHPDELPAGVYCYRRVRIVDPHVECVEWPDGDREWWRDGRLHRDDGPAIECANGTRMWYRHGEIHRDGGPAVECAIGCKHWWQDGVQLRMDHPYGFRVEYRDGEIARVEATVGLGPRRISRWRRRRRKA